MISKRERWSTEATSEMLTLSFWNFVLSHIASHEKTEEAVKGVHHLRTAAPHVLQHWPAFVRPLEHGSFQVVEGSSDRFFFQNKKKKKISGCGGDIESGIRIEEDGRKGGREGEEMPKVDSLRQQRRCHYEERKAACQLRATAKK